MQRQQSVLDFLLTRRSRPSKMLRAPVPDRAELEMLLTAAARSPDHGKLEPWRFVVMSQAAMGRLVPLLEERGKAMGRSGEDIAKAAASYAGCPLAVIVVEVQKPSEKIPAIEQSYSAGAVCLALLNAALAAGWGANWLSGWASHDRPFVEQAFGLAANERVAAIIHIGTAELTPPERPRPQIEKITRWVES